MSKTIRLLIPRLTRWAFFVCSFALPFCRLIREQLFDFDDAHSRCITFTQTLQKMLSEHTWRLKWTTEERRVVKHTKILFYILYAHILWKFPSLFLKFFWCWRFGVCGKGGGREFPALNNFLNVFNGFFPSHSTFAVLCNINSAFSCWQQCENAFENFFGASTAENSITSNFISVKSFLRCSMELLVWKLNNETFFRVHRRCENFHITST